MAMILNASCVSGLSKKVLEIEVSGNIQLYFVWRLCTIQQNDKVSCFILVFSFISNYTNEIFYSIYQDTST